MRWLVSLMVGLYQGLNHVQSQRGITSGTTSGTPCLYSTDESNTTRHISPCRDNFELRSANLTSPPGSPIEDERLINIFLKEYTSTNVVNIIILTCYYIIDVSEIIYLVTRYICDQLDDMVVL